MLLMYCDARYAEYWRQMRHMTSQDERYKSEEFVHSLTKPQLEKLESLLRSYGTGDAVRDEMETQLRRVAVNDMPAASTIILQDWSDPPYFAGWHSWNMGRKSWDVADRMVRPFVDVELYSCGEAFSSEQGWIEGALKSAERVLKALDVPLPHWINHRAYEAQIELWQ
jgi:hypothetical protein